MAKAPVKRPGKPKKVRTGEGPEGDMPAQPPETATATLDTPATPRADEGEASQPATAHEEQLARESAEAQRAPKEESDGGREPRKDRDDRPRRDGKPGGN